MSKAEQIKHQIRLMKKENENNRKLRKQFIIEKTGDDAFTLEQEKKYAPIIRATQNITDTVENKATAASKELALFQKDVNSKHAHLNNIAHHQYTKLKEFKAGNDQLLENLALANQSVQEERELQLAIDNVPKLIFQKLKGGPTAFKCLGYLSKDSLLIKL